MTPSLSLPDEVLIAILGLVDIRVLVRCRQVYIRTTQPRRHII
jgi:hypothetical protein